MAVRFRLIGREPSAVWAVLERPDLYGRWVVGTKDTRASHGTWPELDASLEYTVRLGPKTFRGQTTVRRVDPPRSLELEADSGLLGTARIAVDIRNWGTDRTLVQVDEHPLRGTGGALHNAAVDAALQLRHRAMLGRLARLVESDPAPPTTTGRATATGRGRADR